MIVDCADTEAKAEEAKEIKEEEKEAKEALKGEEIDDSATKAEGKAA